MNSLKYSVNPYRMDDEEEKEEQPKSDLMMFSKKLEQHENALALYFMNYNFVRIHQTLRVTPAMAAGVTDHVWSFKEVLLYRVPPWPQAQAW